MIEKASILQHLIERLSYWNENELDLKEEDLIKRKLQYLINSMIGRIKDTSSSWSTYTMVPDEQISNDEFYYQDYVLYNSKLSSMVKFELFVVKVKKMRLSRNKYESDLVPLGKQLKIMIDKFVLHGVADLVAVGMLVQGVEVKLCKMILAGPGCYLMLEIQTIHLLHTPYDLPLIPSLLERFDQAKEMPKWYWK
ncbi:hypothetical protein INT45_006294 [Circinella minor]|uniref:Uncharacterized protein n=1 Tax=Circinella minor TaxID=1195481 RepID=A0A8H7RCL3_9FUNG|nr:hypothetical protein INT45_006294 [Circinella minor]